VVSFFRRLLPDAPLEPAAIRVGGQILPVAFRRNAKAKRLILRFDQSGAGLVATVPRRVSRKAALEFVERSRGWIETRLAKQPQPASLDGSMPIPLRGELFRIRTTGKARGVVAVDIAARELTVPGEGAHAARRLLDWLKGEARRDLEAASLAYCKRMGLAYRRLTVRDQKSRWGSCSAAGDLSYSWRLILAPAHVLDYVAAHEVAHLKEMNHGPRFWRLVLTHCRETRAARDWLKKHGADIHRYR
jgi:predicted metal-dependent hydrolase